MDLKISDKAFHLAKDWVRNMSGGENLNSEDTEEFELRVDGRPARLGLGAQHTHGSQLTSTLNPLEKKLKAKLDVSKRAAYYEKNQYSRTHLDTNKSISVTVKKEGMDDEDEDVGRASQFSRKQSSSKMFSHLEPSNHKKRKKLAK